MLSLKIYFFSTRFTQYFPSPSSCLPQFIGEHDRSTEDGFEQEVTIERLFKHPQYSESSSAKCTLDYDLALLKLERNLEYNNRVRPVCLPESDFPSGTYCFVTGWGKTKNRPNSLSQVGQNQNNLRKSSNEAWNNHTEYLNDYPDYCAMT